MVSTLVVSWSVIRESVVSESVDGTRLVLNVSGADAIKSITRKSIYAVGRLSSSRSWHSVGRYTVRRCLKGKYSKVQ